MNTSIFRIPAAAMSRFINDGFFILPAVIPSGLLQKLHNLFEEEMNDPFSTRKAINTVNGKSYIPNIDHLLTCNNQAALELLGFPPILEAAAHICGEDFFLIQEFAVIKMLGDNTVIDWHKDFLHQRSGRCFNMGIYLDDAEEGDGALQVVPGSHRSDEDICVLKNLPSVAVPVKAGDILGHDMLLAHASWPLQRNTIRRVIYFEFLSYSQAIRENLYKEEQLINRFRLIRLAISYYQHLHPDEKKFEWRAPVELPEEMPGTTAAILADIHNQPALGKPSAYCFPHRV